MPSSYGASLTPSLYTPPNTHKRDNRIPKCVHVGMGAPTIVEDRTLACGSTRGTTVCVTCSSRPGYVVFYQDQSLSHPLTSTRERRPKRAAPCRTLGEPRGVVRSRRDRYGQCVCLSVCTSMWLVLPGFSGFFCAIVVSLFRGACGVAGFPHI